MFENILAFSTFTELPILYTTNKKIQLQISFLIIVTLVAAPLRPPLFVGVNFYSWRELESARRPI